MTTININEAKTHLSRYTKLVKAGETVILADRNKPFAEIRPLPVEKPSKKRKLGQLEGKVQVGDSFWETDRETEAEFFEGGIFPQTTER